MLHFSPSRILQKKLRRIMLSHYITTDYNTEANTDKHYDIIHIPEPAESFDMIICFHILEHISDDRKAIHELYRIAERGGVVLIQTPYKEGDIYEDNAIIDPAERLHHFGQEDHVRKYSAEGLRKRLQDVGFMVDANRYAADPNLGLKEEIIMVCKRPK